MSEARPRFRLRGRRLDLAGQPRCDVDVDGGQIVGLSQAQANRAASEFAFLAPGFVDLQINGILGREVGVHADALTRLHEGLPAHGVTACLPTLVSSELEVYAQVNREWQALKGHTHGTRLLGLHFEGPFLAPEKRGAHRASWVSAIETSKLNALLECEGLGLVTMAPELDGATEAIRAFVDAGVIVSLGHSQASFAQAKAAVDAGARSMTHLFNAMRGIDHRDPGLALLALRDPRVFAGLIADGVHLHAEVLQLALASLGAHRAYVVSDAMPAAGLMEGEVTHFAGSSVRIEGGKALNSEGRLAGSVALLDEALDYLVQQLGLDGPQALALVARNPALLWSQQQRKTLGAQLHGLGQLSIGGVADLIALDEERRVCLTVVDGLVVYDRDGVLAGAA